MSSEQQFQEGEVVDVVIKGVFVQTPVKDGYLTVNVGCDEIRFGLDEHGVTVTPVAPANWPPQPGDLWRRTDFHQPDPVDDEPDLGLWFAHYDHAIDRGSAQLILVPAHGDIEYAETNPEKLRASGGRWTLVHREQQNGGAQ